MTVLQQWPAFPSSVTGASSLVEVCREFSAEISC